MNRDKIERTTELSRRVQTAHTIARAFHETYEQLAAGMGYETRIESRVPWDQVPAKNRMLMTRTVMTLLEVGTISPAVPAGPCMAVLDPGLPELRIACALRFGHLGGHESAGGTAWTGPHDG
jgi:hypothetical protein